jgi:uroporphyrinogen decarboxylase
MTMQSKLEAALQGENTSGISPIWLMRQAGRWLPEYRQVREKHSFLTMVKTPEIAAEVTLQPIRRFSFDAAIIFSDILVIPEALGMALQFVDSVGPVFERPLRKESDLQALIPFEKEKLQHVAEAISLVRGQTQTPVLGFAGAPYTVASYMIEGRSSRTFSYTKKWLYEDPSSFFTLLDTLCEATIEYLHMQIDAGAVAIQLFESWADALSEEAFTTFSLPYLQRIEKSMQKRGVPLILFSRGSSHLYPLLADKTTSALSLEWQIPLSKVRLSVGKKRVLQGNFDPALLLLDPKTVQKEAKKLVNAMSQDPAFIFNLGHGALPETRIDSVQALVDTVRS